jgi:hypothetical protein
VKPLKLSGIMGKAMREGKLSSPWNTLANEERLRMNTSRRTAKIVGALFLISNVTFILGATMFIEPSLGAPDYLTLVSASRSQVVLGVVLELINGLAYLGIGVLMFPILKQRFESLALGYVAFRVIEFIMQALSDLSPLALLTLSEDFVKAGAPAASPFQTSGAVLLADRYWAFQLVSIALGLGALLLYSMLFRSELVPRFISVWGLIGAVSVLITALLEMFAVSVSPGLGFVLGVPMLLNELFLGGWLIVKGFNSASIVALSTK